MPKVAKPRSPEKSTNKPERSNGKPKQGMQSREVLYPEIKVRLCIGENALTDEVAKTYLGWQEVDKGDYDLTDERGKRVRLCNNFKNRKFKPEVARMYTQLILERQWEVNCESMIVGRTGQVISAQHRMVALILACQIWENDPGKWEKWKTRPMMECLIVVGCDETDRVVNTIDTGSPRTFADVVYRSPYFAGMDNAKRDALSKLLSNAVKFVEHRSHARSDSFSQVRPHAEGLEFLDNHLTLLKCVKHIHEENAGGKLSKAFLNAGYAAGLMYLMATGTTDPTAYRSSHSSEKNLSFDNYDLAESFFTHVAQGAEQFKSLYDISDEIHYQYGTLSRLEGVAILVNAWLLLTEGEKITKDGITPQYTIGDDGVRTLNSFPTVGGIDKGEDDDTEPDSPDPSPEEIEQRSAKIKADKSAKKAGKKQPAPEVGMQVWIPDDDSGAHITGKVTEIYDGPAGQVCKVKFPSKKVFEFPAADCLTIDPNAAG